MKEEKEEQLDDKIRTTMQSSEPNAAELYFWTKAIVSTEQGGGRQQ